jgi:hypothetical protein
MLTLQWHKNWTRVWQEKNITLQATSFMNIDAKTSTNRESTLSH